MSKAGELVKLLTENGLRISAAESCTGGLFCAAIVEIAGASAVLDSSYITYANSAKQKLGVRAETLEKYGAVSEQTAGEMAAAAAAQAGAQIGVGISGIAGPGGGSAEKPVGTVCFGFWVCGKIYTFTEYFKQPRRAQIRRAATDYALQKAFELTVEHTNITNDMHT